MTGKHRVSHLAIMMDTVETWFLQDAAVSRQLGGKEPVAGVAGEGAPFME
jgi:hypothetical protein